MRVRDFMTPYPLTVHDRTRVADAREFLRTHGIHALPVVDADGRLIGMVSDRDLRETLTWLPVVAAGMPAEARRAVDDIEVGVVMTPVPVVIGPDEPLEAAVALMRTRRVGGLPVVDAGELVGIITETDVMRAFEVSLGADCPGVRSVLELHGGAALWQHLRRLEDSDNPATHVVVFRDRRGGHERAVIRTARPAGG